MSSEKDPAQDTGDELNEESLESVSGGRSNPIRTPIGTDPIVTPIIVEPSPMPTLPYDPIDPVTF